MSRTAEEDASPRRIRLRGWSANLLLVLTACLVAGGIGEIAVRLILADRIVLFPRYHTKAEYGDYTLRRLRPTTVFWHTSRDGHWRFATNAKGFRNDRDIPYGRLPDRLRVLTLGDSHTEGFEVRQEFTYSAVIENWLNSHGAAADVVNTGVSGYGTAEALAFLENEGVKYHPDVVVYGFYANDFDDNVRSGLFALERGSLTVKSKAYAPATNVLDVVNAIPPVRWLSEHSYLYSLAFNTIWDWFKSASVRRARKGRATDNEYATAVQEPNESERLLAAALVSRMSQFCRSRGILLIVIDIPVHVNHGVGAFTSSIPPSLLEGFRHDADALLLSHDILDPYQGVAEIHVEHGQNHISELTHLMFGVRAAQVILDKRATRGDTILSLSPRGRHRSGALPRIRETPPRRFSHSPLGFPPEIARAWSPSDRLVR